MPRKSNTRAASGAGSIRQRPDGRWEARVTVGSNPGTGKPIRRSIYGDTQAAVRKEMTAVLRDVDRGTYQTPSKMTVKIWMETWLDTFCTGLKAPDSIRLQHRDENPYCPCLWSNARAGAEGYSCAKAVQ